MACLVLGMPLGFLGFSPFWSGEGKALVFVYRDAERFSWSEDGMHQHIPSSATLPGIPRECQSLALLLSHLESGNCGGFIKGTEHLTLIRRQLYSGHKSISSGKRGETQISALPSRECLRNSVIYKNMQAVPREISLAYE